MSYIRNGNPFIIGREFYPTFSVNASNTAQIITAFRPNAPSEVRVVMNNGHLHVDDTAPSCLLSGTGLGGYDATETMAAGLWHLFYVPAADGGVALVASQNYGAEVGGSGPPSHPVYRYAWSIVVNGTGPVVINKFKQEGYNYHNLDRTDSTWEIVSDANGSNPAGSQWVKITALDNVCPSKAAGGVFISAGMDTDAASNELAWVVCGGDPPPFTPANAGNGASLTGPWWGTTAGTNDRNLCEAYIPLADNALSYYVVAKSASVQFGIAVRGYTNNLARPTY